MKHARDFDPHSYWSTLVAGNDPLSVDEVGHPDMGRAFNIAAYELRLRALIRALRVVNALPPRSGVFEAAFGVGFYLRLWRRLGCKPVVGVDLSDLAWRNVQQRFSEFDLRVGNLADIDRWPDWSALSASFGLVTAIDVLYHIIDDEEFRRASRNLAQLVAPGGVLVITDKFAGTSEPVRETRNVVRRPLSWYVDEFSVQGLCLEEKIPVFWCMDPPVFYGTDRLSATLASAVWKLLRASTKFWPRNGRLQNLFGTCSGGLGKAIDGLVVPRLKDSPNLALAAFRKRA